jgi:hypothetical protein
MSSRSHIKLIEAVLGIVVLLTGCANPPSGAPATLTSLLAPVVFSNVLAEPTNTPAGVSTPTTMPAGYLFIDDFTDPSSGWDVRHDTNAITDYQNGEFVIFVGKVKTTLWSKPNFYLTNVLIEVDTREAAGPDDNLYGVICRYQDLNNFYRFVIAGNGYAGITKRANGVVTVLSGSFLTRSPAVNRGQSSNHLKVICDGTQLSLFVNDQLVAQVQDGDFSGGDAGLLASTGKHAGVEIHFSHFTIKQP